MSAPEDRLIGDGEADSMEREALLVLAQYQHRNRLTQQLAQSTLVLLRDRSARQELAAVQRSKEVE